MLHDRDFAVGLVQNNELSDPFEYSLSSMSALQQNGTGSLSLPHVPALVAFSIAVLSGRGNIRNHIHEMFQHRLVKWQPGKSCRGKSMIDIPPEAWSDHDG